MAQITLNSDLMLHSTSGPAVDDGDIQIWFVNGIIHRDDGPALTIKSLELSYYYNYGKYHNTKGPAITTVGSLYMNAGLDTRNSSKPPTIATMSNYRLNSSGDTVAIWSDNINIWMSIGKLHRLRSPAIVIRTDIHMYSAYYTNGNITYTPKIKPTITQLYVSKRIGDTPVVNCNEPIIEKSWWDNLSDIIAPNLKKNYENYINASNNSDSYTVQDYTHGRIN